MFKHGGRRANSGRPKLSIEHHIANGTFRADRHGSPLAHVCSRCGISWLGRKKRFCSQRCRQLARYEGKAREKNCVMCGKTFATKVDRSRFCSKACAVKWKNRDKVYEQRQCEECGKGFRKRCRKNDAGRFCSRECAFKCRHRVELKCDCCRRPFRAYGKWSKWCSRCKSKGVPEQIARAISDGVLAWIRLHQEVHVAPHIKRGCKVCGAPAVVVNRWRSTYCRLCRDNAARASRKKARKNRCYRSDKKRAEKYGVPYVAIQRRSIWKRDNWTCWLCNQKVRQDVHYLHPLAATIDHVIPISRGGGHVPENIRCACRQCNTRKSTKIYDDSGMQAIG